MKATSGGFVPPCCVTTVSVPDHRVHARHVPGAARSSYGALDGPSTCYNPAEPVHRSQTMHTNTARASAARSLDEEASIPDCRLYCLLVTTACVYHCLPMDTS